MAKQYTVKAILEAKDNASPQIGKVRGAFESFGSFLRSGWVQAAAIAGAAFGALTKAFREGIQAASESEEQTARLEAALRRLGPAGASVAAALREQSAELQKATRFSDDAVTSAQAFLATVVRNADQLPAATQATVDLAAALKIDLDSAAKQVGRTLNGVVSRDLRGIIPELGRLDAAALKSGEGLALISRQFAGRAAADAATYAGSLDRLRNAFDDLLEKLGESVTKNPEVRASFERLIAVLSDPETIGAVEKFGTAVVGIATTLAELAASVPGAVQSIGDFGRGISTALTDAVGLTREQVGAIGELNDATVDYTAVAQSPAVRAISAWIDGMVQAGAAARAQASATRDAGDAALLAADGVNQLSAANERLAGVSAQIVGTEERLATARRDLASSLADSGIKLRDLAAEEQKLEENERALLDLIRSATQDELPSYELALTQVRKKLAEVRGDASGAAADVRDFGAATFEAADGARAFTGALDSQALAARAATDALRSNTRALIENGEATEQIASAAGGTFTRTRDPRTIAGGTFTTIRRVDVAA